MAGSPNRIHARLRTVLPIGMLAGALALAGCGGSGGGSQSATAPVSKAPATSGGVVTAVGTRGLVGPATRATATKQQFDDAKRRIPARARGKTGAQNHGVDAAASCTNTDAMPDDSNLAQLNDTVLCLVNAERADPANGSLPPLNRNGQLEQAANGMCQRMITEHFFAHETPDGKNVVDRIQPTGYIPSSGDWVVGENLAWGTGPLSTPQAIVNGWMNSPGHKANILAPDYKDIGLAACNGSPLTTTTGGTVYVNNFGAKSGADTNVTLPGHGTTPSGNSAAAATVAGTKATRARARAKARRVRAHKRAVCVRHARKKIHSAKKRKAAVSRCRKRY